jgi:hypothetical protein
MAVQTYNGGCHCGRVRFEISTDLSRATECNCSICSKKGYLHHLVGPERFRMLSGSEDSATYQFGTRVARHLFCRHCGVASFYRPSYAHVASASLDGKRAEAEYFDPFTSPQAVFDILKYCL